MQEIYYLLILLLATLGYFSAVYQMLKSDYSPSFFSRGVWFLLTINSFAGVFLGDGSTSSVILAATFFVGCGAIFAVSFFKGSRDFGWAEKISLVLLIFSGVAWAVLDAPFIGLAISLIAHFIGGIPTIWRIIKKASSEQAYHWYFLFTACIFTILASENKQITSILFPVYFMLFDGLIILLVNRHRFKLP